MEFDYTKLNKKINEKIGFEELNKAIEWDGGDLYERLEGKSFFSIDEMNKVMEALDIDSREVEDYFFINKQDKKSMVDLEDEICDLKDKLKKIHFVLSELTDDYEFQEKPDIRSAVRWLDNKEKTKRE